MSTLLAKIQIHSGKETTFVEVMAYMYKKMHTTEEGVLRYEYWRVQDQAGMYPITLSDWWLALRGN